MTEQFLTEQQEKLETMRDDLLRTVDVETDEFNTLFSDLATKDNAEIAKELEDHTAIGMMESIDRERLRNISSALYRIDHGTYGVCASCGSEIQQERLSAMPTASLCIYCKERREEDQQ